MNVVLHCFCLCLLRCVWRVPDMGCCAPRTAAQSGHRCRLRHSRLLHLLRKEKVHNAHTECGCACHMLRTCPLQRVCLPIHIHMYTHTEHRCAAVMCDMISTYVRTYVHVLHIHTTVCPNAIYAPTSQLMSATCNTQHANIL